MQQAKVCGRLDRNRVARARNGAERQDQRLGAADGNDEVVRRQRLAPAHRTPRDLATKLRVALRAGVDVVVAAILPRSTRQMPVQSACVQQFGARDRAAERHEVRIGRMLQELDDHAGDADLRSRAPAVATFSAAAAQARGARRRSRTAVALRGRRDLPAGDKPARRSPCSTLRSRLIERSDGARVPGISVPTSTSVVMKRASSS